MKICNCGKPVVCRCQCWGCYCRERRKAKKTLAGKLNWINKGRSIHNKSFQLICDKLGIEVEQLGLLRQILRNGANNAI